MCKILFCQPIFIPDNNLLKKNLESLKSLKYILEDKPDNFTVTFKLSGWVKKEEYWNNLKEIVEKQNFEISYERLQHNFGKGYNINKIVSESQEDYDYILTCDSDIIFLKNQHYLERFVECINRFPKGEAGIIAPELLEMGAHDFNMLNQQIIYEGKHGKEILKYNKNKCGGLAGGCIFIDWRAWKKINGYKLLGIFGGDDGRLMADMYENNYLIILLFTMKVIHPFDIPGEKYRTWKQKFINRKAELTKEDLIKQSKEALKNLWKDP